MNDCSCESNALGEKALYDQREVSYGQASSKSLGMHRCRFREQEARPVHDRSFVSVHVGEDWTLVVSFATVNLRGIRKSLNRNGWTLREHLLL